MMSINDALLESSGRRIIGQIITWGASTASVYNLEEQGNELCIIQKYKGKKVYLNGDPKGKERIVIDVGICSINGGTYCIKIGEYWYPIYSIVLI